MENTRTLKLNRLLFTFLLFKIIYSGAFSPVASKGPQMKSLPLKISALLCY